MSRRIKTLIVNGEDRPDEEFYTFSNHFAYGINFRSNTLSLYRFKAWLMLAADCGRHFERETIAGKEKGIGEVGEGGLSHQGATTGRDRNSRPSGSVGANTTAPPAREPAW